MKRFTALLLAALMLLALAACGGKDDAPKEDKKMGANGLFITLPANYMAYDKIDKEEFPDLAAAFMSKDGDIAIYCIREDLSEIENSDSFTADDYLEAQHKVSTGTDTSEITESGGVKYYTYSYVNEDNADDVIKLTYLNSSYRSDDAFWLVQFCCRSDSFDANKADFIKWAKTVTFE